MGKNMKKNKPVHISKLGPRIPHTPTAFELAYKDAMAQKKSDASIARVAPKHTATSKPNIQKQQTAFHKQSPGIGSTHLTNRQFKEKPTYNPPQSVVTKKKENLVQHPEKNLKYMRKTTPPVQRGKPKINLGLDPVKNQSFDLNISVAQDQNQNHSLVIKEKAESLASMAQVHNGNFNSESDIVIGFDFGTSSSKIVIRDSGRGTAYAIPSPCSCSGNTYLIPTRIFINKDGHLSLSKGDHSYTDLKVCLMDRPEQIIFMAANTSQKITALELAAGYMALVIYFARAWFLNHTRTTYIKTNIHWHINLGIPSKNYDDHRLRKTFQTIVMAAWRISRHSRITIEEVKKYLKESEHHIATKGDNINPGDYNSIWLHPDYVNTHPEVIMEVVGYAHSPLRTAGLHLIVDIGATTLDAATFIIHEREGEDVFPLLVTEVERLGTIMLHKKRVEAVKTSLERSLSRINNIDPIIQIPDYTHYETPLCKEDILKSDELFMDQCSSSIGKALRTTKDHRDPNSSVWDTELPVFICGGGGRNSMYKIMIDELGQNCAHNWTFFKGFKIKNIPKPDELHAPELSHKEYDRLAVAYGLSFTSDEIGEVIQESKISNITKQASILNVEDRYISKDMC